MKEFAAAAVIATACVLCFNLGQMWGLAQGLAIMRGTTPIDEIARAMGGGR